MRVLIADDEAFARDRLRQLLAAHPQCEVVGEADNGTTAVQLTTSLKPDVLFLDVQMPGASGLDVAARLPGPQPAIVFCTAFDQYAVDAFELNAVDYLLKPVSRARLAQSLQRLFPPSAASTDGDSCLQQPHKSRFLVKTGSHYVVVPTLRIAFFETVDGLTRLTTGDGHNHWLDVSLQDLEAQVDPARFFRISRNAIISVSEVLEVHPLPGGSAEVALKRGIRFEVSRRRVRAFLSALEQT